MVESQLELDLSTPLDTLPQLWTPDDIFNACDQRIIEQFGEDGRVERKRATISQKLLAEYVSMWSNTLPSGGVMLIGVNNDGRIVGCKDTEQNHLNDLEAVRTLCSDGRLGSGLITRK